jgi:hypothetical protein
LSYLIRKGEISIDNALIYSRRPNELKKSII